MFFLGGFGFEKEHIAERGKMAFQSAFVATVTQDNLV